MVSRYPLDQDTTHELASWLTPQQMADTDIHEFVHRVRRVHAEEKQSDPADWTPSEKAAYGAGNWQEFSRLRGYTDEEIANYSEFIRLVNLLDARYGEDFAICLDFEITQLDLGQRPKRPDQG